ncbi:hypothetical protein ACLKA6_017417 [Drosophila palustris]
MHWTLTVALIGSFLVAVSGQCAHLETKIQQDLALISKLQDQLTDLQWKLAENLFKDDLIAGWKEYKRGFGSLKGEFFLGLEHIYRMTNYERYELFIQLDSTKGGFIYARYDDFQIGNEASRYVLRKVGAMTGTAEDRLTIHVGHMFSTYDQGDMMENENVAVKYHSGWWHVKTVLGISNLNGRYYQTNADEWDGMHWETNYSHKIVKMMIRPFRV